jgi:hypothetical protein
VNLNFETLSALSPLEKNAAAQQAIERIVEKAYVINIELDSQSNLV